LRISEEYVVFAKDNEYTLFEASASTGLNVENIFIDLASQILHRNKSELAEVKEERGESLVLFDLSPAAAKKRKGGKKCCTIM
jgi:hypothetical protein